jgi:membrane protein required for colicin V production
MRNLGAIDIVFSVVLGISVLLGLWRGMTRELVSVIAWVLIAVLCWRYAAGLGKLIPFDLGWPFAQMLAGMAIIVLAGVVLSVVIGRGLRALVAASPLAGADRVLGAVFGAVRACLVMLVAAALIVEGGFSAQPFWRQSASGPVLENLWRRAAGVAPARPAPMARNAVIDNTGRPHTCVASSA